MTISTAIERAIEGGWERGSEWSKHEVVINGVGFWDIGEHFVKRIPMNGGLLLSLEEILLDPLFFKALGKAMGWEYKEAEKGNGMHIEAKQTDPAEREAIAKEWNIKPDWLVYWHRMIDALASGSSIEEFFTSLN